MFLPRPTRVLFAVLSAALLFAVDGRLSFDGSLGDAFFADAHANRSARRAGKGGVFHGKSVQLRRRSGKAKRNGTLERPASVRKSQKNAAKALVRGERGVTGRRTKDGRLTVTQKRKGRSITEHANGVRTEAGKGGTLRISGKGAATLRVRRKNGTFEAPKAVADAQLEAVRRHVSGDPNVSVKSTSKGIRTTVTDGDSKTTINSNGTEVISGPGGKMSIGADGTRKVQLRNSKGRLGSPRTVSADQASDVASFIRGKATRFEVVGTRKGGVKTSRIKAMTKRGRNMVKEGVARARGAASAGVARARRAVKDRGESSKPKAID